MSEPYIVLPGQGHVLDLGNFKAEVLASADQTEGTFSLLLTQEEPPGFGPPLHRHRDAAEAFFVMGGEYLMFFGDGQQLCPPGTFVYVPRGLPHTFQVTSSGPGRKLNLFPPPPWSGSSRSWRAPKPPMLRLPELLDQIAERHDMEVLGPVPKTYL